LFNACVAITVVVQPLQNNHQRSLEGMRRGPKQSSTRSSGFEKKKEEERERK
jgi:hypothetical protein